MRTDTTEVVGSKVLALCVHSEVCEDETTPMLRHPVEESTSQDIPPTIQLSSPLVPQQSPPLDKAVKSASMATTDSTSLTIQHSLSEPVSHSQESPSGDQLSNSSTGEEVTVRVTRKPGSELGISIVGGKGSRLYEGDDESIMISRVAENGPSDKAGLRVGDRIKSINDNSLVNVDHNRAVEVIKSAGDDVTMVVTRKQDKLSQLLAERQSHHSLGDKHDVMKIYGEIITTTLVRGDYGLGFTIIGDGPFYISRIIKGSAADKHGRILVGDRIICINGVDVSDAKHDRGAALLTDSEKEVVLVLYREHLVLNDMPSAESFSAVIFTTTRERVIRF